MKRKSFTVTLSFPDDYRVTEIARPERPAGARSSGGGA